MSKFPRPVMEVLRIADMMVEANVDGDGLGTFFDLLEDLEKEMEIVKERGYIK